MNSINRRKFVEIGCGSMALNLLNLKSFSSVTDSNKEIFEPTPLIHATDLYHPHADPDDHWDLASIYALSYLGYFDLLGILIDYPSGPSLGDPDVMGIAQLNYYTGSVVPAIIGSSYLIKKKDDIQVNASYLEHQSINWIVNVLRKSKYPVVINIVGTVNDIAIAVKREPGLFYEKCKGIYLNAGSAYIGKDGELEYNVSLNPFAYAAIFEAPCPIYWLPCKNNLNELKSGENGSFFQFLQGDILPCLPKRLQNYFLFMLGDKIAYNWFRYLNGEPEYEKLKQFGNERRSMWCTAGFLHAANKFVNSEGGIVSACSNENSVFSFIPVKVNCDDTGRTTWKYDANSRNRFILQINDIINYQKAMTIALKNMLLLLPL